MKLQNKTETRILNELAGTEITEVISSKKSETTESFYLILKDVKDDIYQLQLSDHSTIMRDKDLEDDLEELEESEAKYLTEEDFEEQNNFKEILVEGLLFDNDFDVDGFLDFYNINKITTTYNPVKTNTLKGTYNLDRSVALGDFEDCKVVDVELSEENRVMKMTYNDQEEETYVDYTPSVYELGETSTPTQAELFLEDFYTRVFHKNEEGRTVVLSKTNLIEEIKEQAENSDIEVDSGLEEKDIEELAKIHLEDDSEVDDYEIYTLQNQDYVVYFLEY